MKFTSVLLFLAGAAVCIAKAPAAAPAKVLHAGTYRIEFTPEKNWEAEAIPESACAVFRYVDRPAMTASATIAIFRMVVPPAARGADRVELASAYAVHDVAGAQKALFKANAGLVLVSKKARLLKQGQLFSYWEAEDARGMRESSSKFIRGWVYFPSHFATTGALYLLLGLEQFPTLTLRPDELEKAEQLIGGLRED